MCLFFQITVLRTRSLDAYLYSERSLLELSFPPTTLPVGFEEIRAKKKNMLFANWLLNLNMSRLGAFKFTALFHIKELLAWGFNLPVFHLFNVIIPTYLRRSKILTAMSNKRRVFVTIHHRDALSLGENRGRLGRAAYHWGIFVAPKASIGQEGHAYDVTNGVDPDPDARVDRNPNRDWFFRVTTANLKTNGHLLGMVMIGEVPNNVSCSDIEARLKSVPLPQKGVVPEQNCVTWIMAAIQQLQQFGLAKPFDQGEFMANALKFADQRLESPDGTVDTISYTS
jgi:hypothetical protein